MRGAHGERGHHILIDGRLSGVKAGVSGLMVFAGYSASVSVHKRRYPNRDDLPFCMMRLRMLLG